MKTNISILFFTIIIAYSSTGFGNDSKIENVRMTNIGATQFTVSWTSSNNEMGYVKYGHSNDLPEDWKFGYDDRGEKVIDDIHHVTIKKLKANTSYSFFIISNNVIYNNNNSYYTARTGPVLTPVINTCQPSGKVVIRKDNTINQNDSIVYITIPGNEITDHSATGSMIVSLRTMGYWFMDLSNFRNSDQSQLYSNPCVTDLILIEAQSGKQGTATMVTPFIEDVELPPLILDDSQDMASTIISMTATVCPFNKVVLQWRHLDIQNEKTKQQSTIGFNIWRSDMNDKNFIKINDSIIPNDSVYLSIKKYSFIDLYQSNSDHLFYKLEEIQSAGQSKYYDAISAESRHIKLEDIVVGLQVLVGIRSSDDVSLIFLDFNNNNKIDIQDIIELMRIQ